MSSNQALMDALTLRQIFIERYSRGEAQRLLTHLQRLSRQLQATISTEYERVRAVRLAQQVSGITQTILDEYGDDMADGLRAFAEAEAEFARQTLVATTAAEVISPGSLRQIQAAITKQPMRLIAGKAITEITIDAAAKQFSTAKAKQIAQIVRDGATVGRTTQELVSDIALLVENRTKAQAASLVRTSTNHIGNIARNATYQANDDVVDGWEFVATLDSATTITCASLDGNKYKLGEGPQLPLHWGERSVPVPTINPEYNLGSEITGQRASSGGPVSANRTYGGWLADQREAVQDEVLGVERAKLFRSGKLSIGKFTDDTGKVYSLERLKELNPLAFGGAVAQPARRSFSFSPVKTAAEAERRIKALGIPNVKLTGLKGAELNAVLEALEREAIIKPITINTIRTFRSKNISGKAFYESYRNEIGINVAKIKPGPREVAKIVPYKDQLTDATNTLSLWQTYRDDPRYNQSKVISAISRQKTHIDKLRQKITSGETARAWSISETFDSSSDSLFATITHELGHHRHFQYDRMTDKDFRFNPATSVTEYGRSKYEEYFAEWYAAYRLDYKTDMTIPDDVLAIIRKIDEGDSTPDHLKALFNRLDGVND